MHTITTAFNTKRADCLATVTFALEGGKKELFKWLTLRNVIDDNLISFKCIYWKLACKCEECTLVSFPFKAQLSWYYFISSTLWCYTGWAAQRGKQAYLQSSTFQTKRILMQQQFASQDLVNCRMSGRRHDTWNNYALQKKKKNKTFPRYVCRSNGCSFPQKLCEAKIVIPSGGWYCASLHNK